MKKITKFAPWLIVFAALLWAIDAPFRVYLTEGLSATLIVLSEHILVFFFVLPIFINRFKEIKNLDMRDWGAIIFIALGGSALALIFFTQSFMYVNPSVAILLQKVQPFIAIVLAFLILKEKLPKLFYLWAIIGIGGVYLVSFPEFIPEGLSFAGGGRGVLYALLAAFFWGGSTVMGRYIIKKVSWQMTTALRYMVALVFLFIINIWNGAIAEYSNFTMKDGFFVAIIALLAGLVALFFYYRGLAETRASVATIGELAFPVAAVVVNWIFLDAKLGFVQIVGALILIAALMQITRQNKKSLEENTSTHSVNPAIEKLN